MPEATEFIRPEVRSLAPYSPIVPLEALSQELGIPEGEIVKLDANENPYGPLPQVREMLAHLQHVHLYPDPESRALRGALSEYHNVPAENLLAGAGADELIDLIIRLFIRPGDAVLTCPPTFGMYAFDAAVQGARVVAVPRRRDFSLDLEAIRTVVVRERPRLLFVASPNNPDGGVIPQKTLAALRALPLVVVLDEAYIEFSGRASLLARAAESDNLIVLRTFSKWAGLAGLRVGYGAFPSALMPHLWKIKQPYNVSVPAAAAAVMSLQHAAGLQAIGRKIIAERERLFAALQRFSFLAPYPSQANFILCRVIGRGAAELKKTLAREGILVRYFDTPGLRDHVRISVGRPEHTDRLLAALAGLG